MSHRDYLKNWAIAENRPISSLASLAFAFLTAALIGGCDFQGDLVPLEIPTAPPQPFQASVPEEVPEVEPAEQENVGPSTSEDAIEFCQGNELFGDEDVGTCPAPGGRGTTHG